jgi:hypothetical protein
MDVLTYILANSKGAFFSTSSLKLVTFPLFDNSHSNMYEVTSHCGFNFHLISDQ